MGLFFSRTCMAYVDSNGKVLTGEALERAKRS